MPPIIVSPADCEVRSVIRFLSAKGVKAIDIHREICAVYGQNIMSDGMVRKWVRTFKDGRTNVHDEKRSGRPSVVNDSLDHPPYSPDLAPSDYHLFLHLKKHLGGKRLQDDDDVKTVVRQWLASQAADFYEEGIQKLVQRYDKCLNIEGNYVEK